MPSLNVPRSENDRVACLAGRRIGSENTMGEPIPSTPRAEIPLHDRLNSWKEIAAYLKRDVTTVQRWEKREGMPVHRHLHARMGSVYAFRTELNDWTHSRNIRAVQDDSPPDVAPPITTVATGPTRFKLLPLAAIGAALAIGAVFWLKKTEYFWKNPIAGAQFQTLIEFEGDEQSAAVSHDGHFVSFLSDRDGHTDVWVTQVGSGELHNLTQGGVSELVNPSIRTLGFSYDDSLVTFWVRKPGSSKDSDINIWAVPTLGGQPKPYLEGVAEFDWSHDGSRLAYHTPGPGDPMFVSGSRSSKSAPIYTAPAGLHSHFPLWAPDSAYIYFVGGALPDKLDIWRIRPVGGKAERITPQSAQLTYPVFLDRRTLLYLATDSDGTGPWLYGMDIERRVPHRLGAGLDRYTSLAASDDGRRLLLTVASPQRSLWRLRIPTQLTEVSAPVRVSLTSGAGFSPRLGPDYLVYVSATGAKEIIWKIANGAVTELWSSEGAQVFGGPTISPDGRNIAFSVRQYGKTTLYMMRDDGTNARIVNESLNLEGAPAWDPDGKSIISSANVQGVPHLFHVPLDGGTPILFGRDYSLDPVWSPDGRFVVYSGPDIGTTFSVNTLATASTDHPLPTLTLTRGARHLVFLPQRHALVFLRGEIQHKNLHVIDLDTGTERPLLNLPEDFDVRDFDISSDGNEVILEREQRRSDVVLMNLPRK
jgi:Tol biopolymer transport system component